MKIPLNAKTGIGIGLVVVLLASVFLIGPAVSGASGTSMTIQLYDEDGNLVYQTTTSKDSFWLPGEFTAGQGTPVTTAVITVTYAVSGHAADSSLAVSAERTATVRLNTYTAGHVNTDTKSLNAGQDPPASGQWVEELALADLITPLDSTGKTYGWGITFAYELEVTEYRADGTQRTATTSLSKYLSIGWSETTQDLTISGSLGFDTQ